MSATLSAVQQVIQHLMAGEIRLAVVARAIAADEVVKMHPGYKKAIDDWIGRGHPGKGARSLLRPLMPD